MMRRPPINCKEKDYRTYCKNYERLMVLTRKAVSENRNPQHDKDVIAMKEVIFSFDNVIRARYDHYFTYPPKRKPCERPSITSTTFTSNKD